MKFWIKEIYIKLNYLWKKTTKDASKKECFFVYQKQDLEGSSDRKKSFKGIKL